MTSSRTLFLAVLLLVSMAASHIQAQSHPLPPDTLLQFPFPLGENWVFSGVHQDDVDASSDEPMSAMDFHPHGPAGTLDFEGDNSTYEVVAMAAGLATKTADCRVEVLHENGWKTTYYHMEAIPDFNQTPVEANQYLGLVANTRSESICEGGNPGTPHVHVSLSFNDQYVALDGVTIGGWTIHSGRSNYDDDPDYMWLARGDLKKFSGIDTVTNATELVNEFHIEPSNTEQLITVLHTAMGNGLSDTIYLSPNSVYTFDRPHAPMGGETDSAFPMIHQDAGQTLTIVGNGAVIERSADSSRPFRFASVKEGAHLIVESTEFRNGAAEFGGAIIVYEGGALTLTDTRFIGNHADESGGAVYAQEGSLAVNGGRFENNNASFGAALASRSTDDVDITAAIFANNLASEAGSAVYVSQGNGIIHNACIVNNPGRGAIYVYNGSIDARSNWWGDASGAGGDFDGEGDKAVGDINVSSALSNAPDACQDIVLAAPSTLQISIADGDIDGLIAAIEQTSSSGAPVEITLAENGRYIFNEAYERDNALPTVRDVVRGTDVTIIGNHAELVRPSNANSRFRFVTVSEGAELHLVNLTLRGGYSEFGGALENYEANLYLEQVTIIDNTASRAGGGIYTQDGTLTIHDSEVVNNRAEDGAGIGGSGSSLNLQNVWIHANQAGQSGGGLSAYQESSLTLEQGRIEGNTAPFGAGIFLQVREVHITNSDLRANRASQSADAIYIREGDVIRIEGSCFEHSGDILRNDSQAAAVAAGNWWGSASGPGSAQLQGNIRVTDSLDAAPEACTTDGFMQLASEAEATAAATTTLSAPTLTSTSLPTSTSTPAPTMTATATLAPVEPSSTPVPSLVPTSTTISAAGEALTNRFTFSETGDPTDDLDRITFLYPEGWQAQQDPSSSATLSNTEDGIYGELDPGTVYMQIRTGTYSIRNWADIYEEIPAGIDLAVLMKQLVDAGRRNGRLEGVNSEVTPFQIGSLTGVQVNVTVRMGADIAEGLWLLTRIPDGILTQMEIMAPPGELSRWIPVGNAMLASAQSVTIANVPLTATAVAVAIPPAEGGRISMMVRGGLRPSGMYFFDPTGQQSGLFFPLEGDPGYAVWSPDGKWLAFNAGNNLYIVSPDGLDLRLVWPDAGEWRLGTFSWAPDSQRLAFGLSSSGGRLVGADAYIQMIDLAGTDLGQIAIGARIESPSWSPDGQQIAYINFANLGQQIHIVNVDGSGDHPLFSPRTLNNASLPIWSPDGKSIAFYGQFPPLDSRHGIMVTSVDNPSPRLIYENTSGFINAISWSSNSQRIVFGESVMQAFADVHIIDVNGAHHAYIARTDQYSDLFSQPAWQYGTGPAASPTAVVVPTLVIPTPSLTPASPVTSVSSLPAPTQVPEATLPPTSPETAVPSLPAPTQVPEATLPPTSTPLPSPVPSIIVSTPVLCPGTMVSRLQAGLRARVIPEGGNAANRIRAQATTASGELGSIPAGGAFDVLEGPSCADGYAWWKVNYNGLVGWTAEGNAVTYWLEPLGSAATLPSAPEPNGLYVGGQATVYTADEGLKLRAAASTSGVLIENLPPGTVVTLLEGPVSAGGYSWWRMRAPDGNEGWAVESADGITTLLPAANSSQNTSPAALCQVITDSRVNLRRGPSTNYDSAGVVEPGSEYTVIGQAINQSGNTWFKLENDLWVRSDNVHLQGDCSDIPRS